MAVGADEILQARDPELLPRGVLPFEKSICDQQDDVAQLHGNYLRSYRCQVRKNSQRNIMGRKCLKLVRAARIHKKRTVSGGKEFQIIVSGPANSGYKGRKAARGQVLHKRMVYSLNSSS